MPTNTMPPPKRRRKLAGGVQREDSDDELGYEDHPWIWIYEEEQPAAAATHRKSNGAGEERPTRTPRSKPGQRRIVGASMGNFSCRIGDTVLLKSDTANEAWVAIICEFIEDDDGEKAANFMWFSTEKEVRNKAKKRQDFMANELYISPSWDINPLASINGKATVLSLDAFRARYPSGKVPRSSKEYGKVFICRRGCNTRTATYTNEFVWEDIYRGTEEDIYNLCELVKRETKASRTRRDREVDDANFAAGESGDEDEPVVTERKRRQEPAKGGTQGAGSRATTLAPGRKRIVSKKALEFTPLATRHLEPVDANQSPFQAARSQLHVASVPVGLPCREKEFGLVYGHLEAAITDGAGTCIYISGPPGTGKTATVREAIAQLERAVSRDELDDFIFVEINGMKISDPHQAYARLWEALREERVSASQALELLELEFSRPNPRRVPCVVLMDELDQLVTKNQGVMYNFFNWPGQRHSRLIVLAVANTMDLPERTLSNKISSRLGLTRITFAGYTHEQLATIIKARLKGIPGNFVDSDAIQFASRKVAAVSGDARRALDICRRAVEIAEEDGLNSQANASNGLAADKNSKKPGKPGQAKVTIATIKRAINDATSTPIQQYLRGLPLVGKMVLLALVARKLRTGLVETTYGDVIGELTRALQGEPSSIARGGAESDDWVLSFMKSEVTSRPHGIGAATTDLVEAGVVILEMQRVELPSKMRLTVGEDAVKLALRDDAEASTLARLLHVW